MIILYASFPVDPSQRDEALELTEMLVEQSNQEEGVIDYRAAVDVEDENVIRFFERYEDEAAVEAHNESAHVAEMTEKLPELLAGEPKVMQFQVSDASELEL